MNEPRKKTWREKRNECLVVLIIVFVVLLSTFIIILKVTRFRKDKSCISPECVTTSVFFEAVINNRSDPCDNFFNFSCGGYTRNSTIEDAQKLVDETLKSLIRGAIEKDDSRSVKYQKKYYRNCMNRIRIETDANRSLKSILKELGGWPLLSKQWNATYTWEEIVDKCIELGLYYDWFVNIHNEPTFKGSYDTLHIKPPDSTMNLTKDSRRSYNLLIENVENILSSTENIDVDPEEISDMINFENDLYQIIAESDINTTENTLDEFLKRFPTMPWKSLLRNVIVDEGTKMISSVDDYLPKLQNLLALTNIRVQMNYILWKIIQSLWPFLSSDIRKAFEVDGDLRNQHLVENREQFCYTTTSTVFSYVSEAVYARRHSAERNQVAQIVDTIKTVLHDHIKLATWMNQTHKEHAISKLKNISLIIGAPDEMYDETKFDELLGTDKIDILHLNNTLDIVRTVDKSRDQYNLNFRIKKVSYLKARFYQGIANIQAFKYLPEENMIYLPAAALNDMFYSNDRPASLNYGALGTIIAHEMVHAFGLLDILRYNNEKEHIMWSNSTIEAFFRAAECLMADCENFSSNTTEIDCQSTSDENFADYSSLDISYEAFRKVDTLKNDQLPGLDYTSPQLFWISYASTMCNNLKVNDTEKLTHMLPSQRIIGSYRNSRHFANDFNCPENSNMNPAKKCSIL